MYKILFDETDKLTTEMIGKVIRKYQSKTNAFFDKAQGYYDGRGQAIMKRVNPDASRPNNRIVKNYCKTIVENFQGYLTGNPVVYSGKDGADISEMQEILDINDVINEDSEFLQDALVNGVAYEIVYMNEDKEVKFKNLNPKCVIPIYSNDLDEKLLCCIYYYPIQSWDDELAPQKWSVNVYTPNYIYHYEASNEFNDMKLIDGETNWFGEVPFVIFDLNKQNTPIFEPIISLQDAYNSLLSDEVNDFEAFVDAYMVLKNLSADEEDLAAMKANRTILVDGDSDVTYLTKDINDTQIQNLLDNINTSIHTVSNSPDFSSEEFNNGVSSGIALQFKLVGFNNIASNIEARFSKALQKRIWLINKMKKLIDTDVFLVDITFKHNLPTSILDTVNMVNSLRGLVSDETLLAQLPFIKDVDEELERIHQADGYFLEEVAVEPFDVEPTTQVDVG
ncbi:phage portal protein [Collinsella tanakaei]|nr:phage portal protein [Collinsella tanakaei]